LVHSQYLGILEWPFLRKYKWQPALKNRVYLRKPIYIMKKLVTLLFLIPFNFFAQDSISVLFIGNSYTYVNDLPTMVHALADSLNDKMTYDSKTNGGYTFLNHWNDPLTYSKINSKQWDYVVIQGQSQEPSFPTGQVNTQSLPYAVNLADSVYSNRFCSQAMYFMTWGRQNGDPQWDSIATFNGMNDRLRSAYLRITDSAQASVAPVGSAWKYVRDNYPSINLYSADGSHPNMEGSYLAACTFYASFYRKSPVGSTYTAGLPQATVDILQNVAALTVLDSLALWKLRPNDEVAIAGFDALVNGNIVTLNNTSWRATDYLWDFGDGSSSSLVSPQHTYLIGGIYTISLIAMNECGEDTLFTQVNVQVNSLETNVQDLTRIERLSESHFNVVFQAPVSIERMQINSLDGRILDSGSVKQLSSNNLLVNLSSEPKGIYFLKVETEKGELNIKLANW
jgi:PKD repeat protein